LKPVFTHNVTILTNEEYFADFWPWKKEKNRQNYYYGWNNHVGLPLCSNTICIHIHLSKSFWLYVSILGKRISKQAQYSCSIKRMRYLTIDFKRILMLAMAGFFADRNYRWNKLFGQMHTFLVGHLNLKRCLNNNIMHLDDIMIGRTLFI